MKLLLILSLVLLPSIASAHSIAEWNRNSESDMKEYGVYQCSTPGCTVQQNAASKVATVPQPLPGSIPTWTLPRGVEGKLAISAIDEAGNESGLSVSVPFDTKTPGIPVTPVLK